MDFKNWLEMDEMEPAGIRMWHGSKQWGGPPEVRGPRKGRYEAGPGIYLTTSYMRARGYSKGGGSTILVTLQPNIRFAHKVQIPVEEAIAFLKDTPRLKKRKEIAADVQRNAERSQRDWVSAEVIINLFVNYEAGAGDAGVMLARWLASKGVDATLHHETGNEDWVVVINPSIIKSHQRVDAKDVKQGDYDFPPIPRT
jgi:hypothetical protein